MIQAADKKVLLRLPSAVSASPRLSAASQSLASKPRLAVESAGLLDAWRAMRDDFLIQDAASFEGKEVSLNPDPNRH
jgi:hypothetical protein